MGGSHANRCYRLIITRSTHDEAPHQTAALSVHQSSMLLHLSLASERSRRSDAMSHHEHDDDHVKVETIAVAVRGRALEGSSRRTRGRLYTRPSPSESDTIRHWRRRAHKCAFPKRVFCQRRAGRLPCKHAQIGGTRGKDGEGSEGATSAATRPDPFRLLARGAEGDGSGRSVAADRAKSPGGPAGNSCSPG
jgi:hypothetical protein